MLREFWFPTLLALAGIAVSLLSFATEGYARRIVLTLAVILCSAAILSYIWGDPVRGPFYKMFRPKATDTFRMHAGATAGFPVPQLAGGIDFSRVIDVPGRPIELWLKKTWWSGLKYRLAARDSLGHVVVLFTDDSVERIPAGWDINGDEYAIELVDENFLPRLQVIMASDNDIYLNVVFGNQETVTVLNGNRLEMKPPAALTRRDFPTRLFKFPSYANHGRRE
jgi:hypothetical protein